MSKYVDTTAIVNVISNIYSNPDLLDNPNYTFYEDDFVEDFHKIVFGSIYNLHNLGVKNITDISIQDYLSKRPKSLAIFQSNNGIAYLQNLKEIADSSTFKYYYDRMKKFTLLRMYNNIGVDLKWLYDNDNIFDSKKKELQENHLDNSSLAEIAEEINKKIEDIKIKYVDNYEDKIQDASDDIYELIDNLSKKPEIGRPMYGKFVNTILKGARLTKFYLRSAPTGVGKAIPNDTIIPTPDGDRLVKDIKVGDYLFDQNCNPTKVLAVYPQGEKKRVWEIEFEDGRIAKCCDEHLWEYKDENGNCKVESLKDIIAHHKKENGKYNISIRLCKEKHKEFILENLFHINQKNTNSSRILETSDVIFRDEMIKVFHSLGLISWYSIDEDNELYSIFIKAGEQLDIVDIRATDEYTDMTCFTVDNEDHLFLMNDYIVTHNTRAMIADACFLGCDEMWDFETKSWKNTGEAQPTLYISTELQVDEVQTMMLAFLSGVNEDHIIMGEYEEGEQARVKYAAGILKHGKIYIEIMPDFSMQDIENTIILGIREYDARYIFFDYLHTSLRILEEITKKSGGVKLREDNILFMIAIRLKDLCNKYGVFILTST